MAGEEVKVIVTGEDRASKEIDKVRKSAQDLGSATDDLGARFQKFQSSMREVGIAYAAVGAAGTFMIKGWVDNAIQAEQVQQRMIFTFKNATGASDEQVQALVRQSEALEKVGVVSAEQILMAQGQLAAFDLQTESVEMLIPAMLDLMVHEKGLNTTMEDAQITANGLGKALQGQTDMLVKQGFKFTEAQMHLLKTGNETERVTALTEILNSTYEGFNEQMRTTTAGAMRGFEFQMNRISQSLGTALLPTIGEFTGKLSELATSFENLSPQTKELIAQVALVVTAFTVAAGAVALFVAALNPITILAGVVVAAVILITLNLDKLQKIFEDVGMAIRVIMNKLSVEITKWAYDWKITLAAISGATEDELINLAREQGNAIRAINQETDQLLQGQTLIYQQRYKEAMEAAENEIARLRDIVDNSTGEAQVAAKKNLEAMKAEFLKQFPEMRLGSTAELEELRKRAEEEMAEMRRILPAEVAKAGEGMKSAFDRISALASSWGANFVRNLAGGISRNQGALQVAMNSLRAIMSTVHQSYNPLLPAQRWGRGFVSNLKEGLTDGMPLVSDALIKLALKFKDFKADVSRATDITVEVQKLKLLAAQLNEVQLAGTEEMEHKQRELHQLQKRFDEEDRLARIRELEERLDHADSAEERKSIHAELDRIRLEELRQAELQVIQDEIDAIQKRTQEQVKAKQTEIEAARAMMDEKKAMAERLTRDLAEMEKRLSEETKFIYQKRLIEEQFMEAKTSEEKEKLNAELQELISERTLARVSETTDAELNASWQVFSTEMNYLSTLEKKYREIHLLKMQALGASGMQLQTTQMSKWRRASGGPVSAGQEYIVGERGPELFVPNRSGGIIPNNRMGGTVVVNFNGLVSSREVALEYADAVVRELKLSNAVV